MPALLSQCPTQRNNEFKMMREGIVYTMRASRPGHIIFYRRGLAGETYSTFIRMSGNRSNDYVNLIKVNENKCLIDGKQPEQMVGFQRTGGLE
ncbi:MAG TPA: hypothetical protein VF144_11860 [Chitinophagaceae bacterium]